MIIFVFISYENFSFAQVEKIWVGDSTRVGISIVLGDTTFFLRHPHRPGEYHIYYDSSFQNEAGHHVFFKREYTYTQWYLDGHIKVSHTSKDSLAHGSYDYKRWYPNGTLMWEVICNGDSSTEISYYDSGATKSIRKSRRDPKTKWMQVHQTKEYYENGQLKNDSSDIDVNGYRQSVKNYYQSGQLNREATCQMGRLIGAYSEWYENGKQKVKGQYVLPRKETEDNPASKIGTWSFYNESGKLIKEEYYEEGKLVKTIEY